MASWLRESELKGELVTLLPLRVEHAPSLIQAASDGDLWDLWFTVVPDQHSVVDYIMRALVEQREGRSLPFVVVHNDSEKIIGTTRYCYAEPEHKRLEIGYTWFSKSFQRSGANTESKFLLLSHAFENLNAIAVEFRTHWHNHVSRAAIARLGAKQDGVLRNHRKSEDGIYRDTVVFSIIDHEWATVRNHLRLLMDRKRKSNY